MDELAYKGGQDVEGWTLRMHPRTFIKFRNDSRRLTFQNQQGKIQSVESGLPLEADPEVPEGEILARYEFKIK